MKKLSIAVVLSFAVPCVVFAQDTSTSPPRPGPEHQKLAGLVGTWTSEGESVASPFGPAEKWSAKIVSEWFTGNFAVVRHVEGKSSASGAVLGLAVIAYDATAKTYTWYGIDSMGWTGLAKSEISGDVLTVVRDVQVEGKAYKRRGILKGLGTDRLTFVSEYSTDGKAWTPYFRSTDTRVKPK
ncbi:MAG TPA: DUF1579 family protein [Actinomycetota bacterium]|nr:DUF1579 family protein [Actinomycetota bacterium]